MDVDDLYAANRAFKFVGSGGGDGGTPSGAIMAFDLAACPVGWSPYAPSSGRFLRGRCISGETCNDPDGTRAIGNVQQDMFKSHNHNGGAYANAPADSGGNTTVGGTSNVGINVVTAPNGGDETRPKNVAVLYCRKD